MNYLLFIFLKENIDELNLLKIFKFDYEIHFLYAKKTTHILQVKLIF